MLGGLLEHPEYAALREALARPELDQLESPLDLPDMDLAVSIICEALRLGQEILICGDRDVDGVSSSALLGGFLRQSSHPENPPPVVQFRVSTDGDDYGLTGTFFRDVLASRAGLVILLDMGSSNGPEIQELIDAGRRVIVLDHHQIHDRAPADARCAFVNPMRLPAEARGLHTGKIATVGLVFKLLLGYALSHTKEWTTVRTFPAPDGRYAFRCGHFLGAFPGPAEIAQALVARAAPDCGLTEERSLPHPDPKTAGRLLLGSIIRSRPRLLRFLSGQSDLASVGLITDMVPLVGENRTIVRLGLGMIDESPRRPGSLFRPGLASLVQLLRINGTRMTSRDLGWSIGPAINAAGRMGNTDAALQLLLAQTETESKPLAKAVLDLNGERKKRTERNEAVLADLLRRRPVKETDPIVFCFDPALEPGVSGILATRLVEQYGRPAVYVNPDGAIARGSVRTSGGFNVLELLSAVSDLLIQWGGHPEAAGFSIAFDRIPALEEALRRAACDLLPKTLTAAPEVEPHLWIEPRQISWNMIEDLRRMEPFGPGNPEPLFGIRRAGIRDIRELSAGRHALFRIEGAGRDVEGVIWFRARDFGAAFENQAAGGYPDLTLLGTIEESDFAGKRRIRFRTTRFGLAFNNNQRVVPSAEADTAPALIDREGILLPG